jgi:hypothetical protein
MKRTPEIFCLDFFTNVADEIGKKARELSTLYAPTCSKVNQLIILPARNLLPQNKIYSYGDSLPHK